MNIRGSSGSRANVRARVTNFLRLAVCSTLAAQLAIVPSAPAANDKLPSSPAPAVAGDPVLSAMQSELARATTELGKTEQPPYYLAYTVYDQNYVVLVGAYGSLLNNVSAQRRQADVTMRVGSPELDNTHGP